MAPTQPFRIDADFHLPPAGMRELSSGLDDYWRLQITDRGIDELPFQLTSYPANSPLTKNPDYAGLDVSGALDRFGTGIAVASMLHGVVALHNPDMRAVLMRAVNDHVARVWLDTEPRLRGSIYVSGEDIPTAVAEIERLAGDARFVQVLMLAMQEIHHGNRSYWPIYEACQKHGLALAIHAGGLYRLAPSVSGWPSYQFEDYVMQSMVFENILTAFLGEGVFQKFPDLKVVFLESGFSWLPTLIWRNDKTWRGVRQEVPWLDRKPSEIMKGRVFLTLQPCDVPGPAELRTLMKHIGGAARLLFSTDYPHRQFSGDPVPDGLPQELVPGILARNAIEAYPRLANDSAVREALAREEVTA